MKLVLDIGNTKVKMALFDGDQIHLKDAFKNLTVEKATDLLETHQPQAAILSSTRKPDMDLEAYFDSQLPFVSLNPTTPLPITLQYKTPETLGKDRIALAVGGHAFYPNQNLLIIDAGTCITYEFVNEAGVYLGGSIHPGITMRFKALHTFTAQLPLVKRQEFDGLIGQSTQEAILAGVQRATIAEMDGMIEQYRAEYPDVKVILTGGDGKFCERHLKNKIFALPDLVLKGLNKILDHYVSTH